VRVAFGCDHAGFELKEEIVSLIKELGHEVTDMGTFSKESVDYPDFAQKVARAVQQKECSMGVVICGTGIGVSIAANKVPKIRAALCTDAYMARMSRAHNDANVLALGSRVIGPGLARDIITAFLTTEFEGDRHKRRLDKISSLESGCC
jgi:ribose 5-phosphate isomerase B